MSETRTVDGIEHPWSKPLPGSELEFCPRCGQLRKPGDPGPASCPVIAKKDGPR